MAYFRSIRRDPAPASYERNASLSDHRQYQPYQSQYQQPPPFHPAVGFVCPFCHTTMPPMTYSKVSTGGWIVFVFLMLTCFGILLAWIGLLMKENYKVCSQCGIKLG